MKHFFHLMLCFAVTFPAAADVLTKVPRQGSMLMPEVYYHGDTDTVTVDLSAIGITAQLTPLLVSNPNDRFDPTDGWFDDLDPSRRGMSFSRRYGFEMDAMSDFPQDYQRALWIRKLASSPELSFYDYNDFTPPLTWNPVFGTAGTSNAVYWNQVMWHFGVTAKPGTNTYSATFEVYAVNTETGKEVPGSSSGPLVLHWTNVPDGRPELAICLTNKNVLVTWPASAVNWTLVSATNLGEPNWAVVTNTVTPVDDLSTVSLESLAGQQFFRLQRNP